MSAKAVTARLKQISQLRRLGLALNKAKIKPPENQQPVTPTKKSTRSK